MTELEREISRAFGHRLRLRVSGICIVDDAILLVKHLSLGKKGILWAPPGGGLIYGESLTDTLQREFLEETGLKVKAGELLLVNEYLESPLHAIELFFKAEMAGGNLIKGTDPEMSVNNQIISEVRFVSFSELSSMDPETLHSMFMFYKRQEDFSGPVLFQQNIKK